MLHQLAPPVLFVFILHSYQNHPTLSYSMRVMSARAPLCTHTLSHHCLVMVSCPTIMSFRGKLISANWRVLIFESHWLFRIQLPHPQPSWTLYNKTLCRWSYRPWPKRVDWVGITTKAHQDCLKGDNKRKGKQKCLITTKLSPQEKKKIYIYIYIYKLYIYYTCMYSNQS